MYSVRSSQRDGAPVASDECHLAICVDENCGCEDCPRRWRLFGEQVPDEDEEELVTLDLDLGEGKSLAVVDSLLTANFEIFGEFHGKNGFYNPAKISAKRSIKKSHKKKPRKQKRSRNWRPFLQNYQRKWQKVLNRNGGHFRNRLVLNPLIFSTFTTEQGEPKFQVPKSKVPFPSSSNLARDQPPGSIQPNRCSTIDPINKLIPARPRFSLQHRRKSSLLNNDNEVETESNPLVIKLCSVFHGSGVCLCSNECLNLHGFLYENRYQHLLQRFVNVLLVETAKKELLGLENFLNKFHSLHPPLPVFRKLLFRRPETCVFDLIKK